MSDPRPAESVTIDLFGDSIAMGLGANGRSYGRVLADELTRHGRPALLRDMTASALRIESVISHRLPMLLESPPDHVIIAHGVTEAIVRPRPEVLRWMPPRWRKPGWMDPRPYYSSRAWRRLGQKFESGLRWRCKVLSVRAFGGSTFYTPNRFEHELDTLIGTILDGTAATILVVSHVGIDERFFPGTEASLDAFYDVSAKAVARHGASGRVILCDVRHLCHRWDDFFVDHFHPNAQGHRRIAACIGRSFGIEMEGEGL